MATILNHPQEQNHESVKRFLSFLKQDVDNSNALINLGAYTSLAKKIESIVTNPLESMISTYSTIHTDIKGIMDVVTKTFFERNKQIIEKAFEVPDQQELHYYIVLKEDNTDNRELIFNFLDEYENLGIDDKIIINIEFIPKRVLNRVNLKSEIVFN